MQTFPRNIFKLAAVLMLVAALVAASQPASIAQAASCSPTVFKDLWAKTGTATLYGSTSVTIWGYAALDTDPAIIPGPVLDVTAGDCVQVTLHNVNIPGNTSLLFQGQSLVPDRTGVAAGGSTSYVFSASSPGTFLYEAGLTPNSQHQVAMGLYGALIVRPTTPGQAYDSPSTAYDKESVLVLGEFDTALSGNPPAFDMRNYKPRYFLINGKAYPGTASLPVVAGQRVLLRYVNAGLQAHAMSTLGVSQTILAQDGVPYALSHKVVAETIATGQTLDTLVNVPASTADGTRYAVYDANMLLRNNTGTGITNSGFGGMLTFLSVTGLPTGADTLGPLLSSLALSPNPSTGAVSVNLSFTANDTTTGNSNVTSAEYWVDGNATHTPIPVGSPAPAVNLSATIPAGLTRGTHVVSVRAQDAAGNWSTTGNINLVVDNLGPTTRGLSLSPNPSDGSVSVTLTFTADDSANGNSNITAAEYFIDPAGTPVDGTGTPVPVASPAPVKIVNAVIASGLGVGLHVIAVHSQDALGNWGALATINLVVDNTGPTTSSVSAAPNPNNGTIAFNTSVQAVRVTASFDDTSSGGANLAAAEGFIDTLGATGTGFVLVATDGAFNSPAESGFADVPLAVIISLSDGNHTVYVRARDAVGNWGSAATTTLVIDKTAPTFTGISLSPNPTAGAATVTLTLLGATDPVVGGASTGVAGGEYWFGTTNPAPGSGTAFSGLSATINVGSLSAGSYTVRARIHDAVGNWSTGAAGIQQATLIVTHPLYFSTAGNSNPPGVGGTADDADIYFYSGSAFSRSIDVTTLGLPGGANVDGFDRVDATHFYLSFNGNVAVPGVGTVADEDIVYYNAGIWSLYFDGSANGIGATDLDAISIVGAGGPGNVYFSTDNTLVPPGAGGTGDDADIYRWNGGSSYTRVIDASALGWSVANVDGLVWIDSTHIYLSYSVDTTVPVIGAVQDEDVVYFNGGVWSVYFDGTSLGLTSANLDIDAFDLP
jgi:hypothetical protein